MKKLILIVVLLLCSGCFEELTATVGNLSRSVDVLQGTTKQLVTDGVIDSEKADKINENIDKVQKDVIAVKDAVATAKDPLDAAEKGWSATEPFNPYYGYGAAAIALLKLLQTTKTKKVVEDKYAAMKIGVEKFRNEGTVDAGNTLYKSIGDARKAKGIA